MNTKPKTYRFRAGRYSKLPKEQKYEMGLTRAEQKARAFIRRQLINSKGAICGICGEPITNMKDCTIDHIIPISKGGLTTLENCQLAHQRCNLMKGDNYEESQDQDDIN